MNTKYVSIDIETTGLDPNRHQILEIAAVIWADDGEIGDQPFYHTMCDPTRDFSGRKCPDIDIVGQPRALLMNTRILEAIDHPTDFQPCPERAIDLLMQFLRGWRQRLSNDRFIPIGKNYGAFDLQFLKQLNAWDADLFHYRSLDAGALYATRDTVPGLPKDLGVEIPGAKHEALYDARLTLEAVRVKLAEQEAMSHA